MVFIVSEQTEDLNVLESILWDIRRYEIEVALVIFYLNIVGKMGMELG
jgi:hypothetical protein